MVKSQAVQVSADFDSAAVFFSLVILLREKTPKVPQNLHCPALIAAGTPPVNPEKPISWPRNITMIFFIA